MKRGVFVRWQNENGAIQRNFEQPLGQLQAFFVMRAWNVAVHSDHESAGMISDARTRDFSLADMIQSIGEPEYAAEKERRGPQAVRKGLDFLMIRLR